MRIFALLCGVAAALAWLALGMLLSDRVAPFVELWRAGGGDAMIGRVIWYTVPAVSVLGALLALMSPVIGGVVLLLAAGGWFAVGSVSPQGPDVYALIPLGIAGIGAISAFLALRGNTGSVRSPSIEDLEREDALRGPRAEPRLAAARAPGLMPQRDVPAAAPRPVYEPPASSAGGFVSGLVVLNTIVMFLLAAIVGMLLYRDYGIEGRPLPWQDQRAVAARAATPPPQAAVGLPQQVATAQPNAVIPTASFADPFRYCTSIGTIDIPDARYSGPAFTQPIAEAVRAPMASSPDRVKWRCVDGAVWACSSFDWPVCSLTPSVGEMMEFCTRNPGARNLQAPNGSWNCEGTKPVIPSGQNWPIDARGFLPQAWVQVPSPAG